MGEAMRLLKYHVMMVLLIYMRVRCIVWCGVGCVQLRSGAGAVLASLT